MGPPRELMIHLRDEFDIDYFVETGTFYASTARWASNEFKSVKTIELSDELHNNALNKYGNIQNIEFIRGKSQEKLGDITQNLDSSAIFWLDAHYSGEGTVGQDHECPLLEELEAIGKSNAENYIFIDDARLFCSPPPRPRSAEDWPTISDIILKMNRELDNGYYLTITEDVIVAVPPSAENIVINYAQDVATKKWNESSIERGVKLIIQNIFDDMNTETNRKILKKLGLYSPARKIYRRFSAA